MMRQMIITKEWHYQVVRDKKNKVVTKTTKKTKMINKVS
jgi:hypothetical protein